MTRPWKPLVYIAGPYSKPDPVLNVRAAVKAADELINAGVVVPFIPHLTHLQHLISPRPYEQWLEIDLEVLLHCDALLRIPGESTGADAEVVFAKANDIPAFDNVEALHEWAYRR